MIKKLILMAIILAVAGCADLTGSVAKQEAYKRWYRTRAQLLCSLATDQFKAGQLDKARGKALEALALDETFSPARLLLGKIHIEQGRYAMAISELTKVTQAEPKSAEALYLLGVAKEKNGLLDDALACYRGSHELDELNMAPVMAAGEVLVNQGQVPQAQAHVESHVKAAGNEPGMYELAGRLAMMRNEYDKAASYYQQAWDLDGKNLLYLEAIARAQFFSGKHREAAENFEALTGAAGYKVPAWALAMIGDCYMAAGRLDGARDAYWRATELNPSDAGFWSNLAKAALATGDTPRAVLAARQALALDGDRLDADLLLGYAMLRDGQVTGSLGHLTQAAGRHPQNAELLCVLGRAHAVAGSQADAVRCYTAALQLEPDNALAKELLKTTGAPKLSKID